MNQNKTEPNHEHKPCGWIIHPDQIPRLLEMPDKNFLDVSRLIMSYCYYGKYDEPDDPLTRYATRDIISRVNVDQRESQNRKGRSRRFREKHKEQSNHNSLSDEEKITYADRVTMTETEYNQLVSEYGEQDTRRMIDKLNIHKCKTNTQYGSDYYAILDWGVKWLDEQKQKEPEAAACTDPEEPSSYNRDELEDFWNKN